MKRLGYAPPLLIPLNTNFAGEGDHAGKVGGFGLFAVGPLNGKRGTVEAALLRRSGYALNAPRARRSRTRSQNVKDDMPSLWRGRMDESPE